MYELNRNIDTYHLCHLTIGVIRIEKKVAGQVFILFTLSGGG